MESRKYYSFETMFTSLKNSLCEFLKANGIRYEVSGVGYDNWVHFEILLNIDEVDMVNAWLDEHTITEK